MDEQRGAGALRAAVGAVLGSAVVGLAVLGTAGGAAASADVAGGSGELFSFGDARITESSGLAASAQHPGVVWTHNDSDDGGRVFAVDERTGRTLATVTLAGIHPRDAEAISLGRDAAGRPALYLADIGDNLGGTWPEVWIYRFTEPAGRLHDTTVTATRFTVRYADGPRNAEALMVQPRTGRVYIASKQGDGGGLYAGPARLSATGVNVFRRVADAPATVTDGAFSPDGTRLVLRGYFSGTAYRWAGGVPQQIGGVEVPLQFQGESVTFTPDGKALLFGSEGEGSTVWRQPLSGAQLPDSARAAAPNRTPAAISPGAAATAPAAAAGTSGGTTLGRAGVGIALLAFLGFGLTRLIARLRRR